MPPGYKHVAPLGLKIRFLVLRLGALRHCVLALDFLHASRFPKINDKKNTPQYPKTAVSRPKRPQ